MTPQLWSFSDPTRRSRCGHLHTSKISLHQPQTACVLPSTPWPNWMSPARNPMQSMAAKWPSSRLWPSCTGWGLFQPGWGRKRLNPESPMHQGLPSLRLRILHSCRHKKVKSQQWSSILSQSLCVGTVPSDTHSLQEWEELAAIFVSWQTCYWPLLSPSQIRVLLDPHRPRQMWTWRMTRPAGESHLPWHQHLKPVSDRHTCKSHPHLGKEGACGMSKPKIVQNDGNQWFSWLQSQGLAWNAVFERTLEHILTDQWPCFVDQCPTKLWITWVEKNDVSELP